MSVDRPVFIVAPHRSGTTLLYEILGRHPQCAYLNRYNKRFPKSPRIASWLTRLTGYDKPMEAQSVWDRFRNPDNDILNAGDASEAQISWYKGLIERVLTLRDSSRFIAKYPRLSLRLEWLNRLFPSALFVHLTRDWRAVVNSTVERKKKRAARGGGWFGVYVQNWQELASLPHEEAATRQFLYVTQSLEDAKASFTDRFITVAYEALCERPLEVMRELCGAVGLPWTEEFENSIPPDLRNANYKWRKALGEDMAARLREIDPEFLSRYEEAPTNAKG